ncbi:hypothetical protein, partial [Massilia eburnea]|uniref:hypothetical protein n=1 Tax=Massilia eburnea TaxID=1776165 RepID=UPI003D6AFB1B
MQTKFKLKPLAAGAFVLLAGVAQAQDAVSPAAVVITGSRIPRASLEGPSAVTVLTGEDITKQGYKNVFDAADQPVAEQRL